MISVRPITSSDAPAWLRMRLALWPDKAASVEPEVARFFAGDLKEPLAVLMAVDSAGTLLGMAELSIRKYAEDCVTDRVAYLEGWYVEPAARRQGVGCALVEPAEAWGRAQGCTEFASDALLDNDVSAAAHAALGFTETVRIRCFKKDLTPPER